MLAVSWCRRAVTVRAVEGQQAEQVEPVQFPLPAPWPWPDRKSQPPGAPKKERRARERLDGVAGAVQVPGRRLPGQYGQIAAQCFYHLPGPAVR